MAHTPEREPPTAGSPVRFMSPRALTSAPWWPRAKVLSLENVLDALHARDEWACSVLFVEMRRTFGVERAPRMAILRTMTRERLESWVKRWTPSREAQVARDMPRALAALAEVLDPSALAPAHDVSPIAAMDLRILGERRINAHAPLPQNVVLPTWLSTTVGAYVATPMAQAHGAAQWILDLARAERETFAREAAARDALALAWRDAASPLARQLAVMRAEVARGSLPATAAQRETAKCEWDRVSDEVVVDVPGLLGCLTGACRTVTLALGASPPRVSCQVGTAPCRGKLGALEAMLVILAPAGELTGTAEAMRAHFARPDWERMLARLRAAGRAEGPSDERRFGWVLETETGDVVLYPSWISDKRGGGVKSKRVPAGELDRMVCDEPRDALAIAHLRRSGVRDLRDIPARDMAQALAALVGRDDVYARHVSTNDLVPMRVALDEPRVEVVHEGGATRLAMRIGDTPIDPRARPDPGGWSVVVDRSAGVMRLAFWSRSAYQAFVSLRDANAQTLPAEASSALAETLIAIAPAIAVKKDASWLGEALPPARDVVFRLGFEGPRGGKLLTLEACARPVPELSPMTPGDGDEVIPVRREGRVGHVVRELAEERARAEAAARDVGLEVAAHAPLTWKVEGLEAAVALWKRLGAAKDAGVHLEWRTREPRMAGLVDVDKLTLRLGLKKDWLDVRGGVALDGGELPLGELLRALRDKKRFVQLDDERVIEIGDTLARELAPLAAMARDDKDGALRTSMFAAPLIGDLAALGATVEGPPEWVQASERLAEAATLEVPVPAGLRAELRPYQIEGLAWAARLAHWAKGACLADEMGLGKTLQALALLLRRAPLGRALVVAPTSVVPNWLREAARFCPRLVVAPVASGAALGALDEAAQVIVTSWDLLVRHAERFAGIVWATVVLDEAHAMKNAATKRAQAAKALEAGFVLALTGTPVENRPSELWSLFQVVAPGLLGSAESFRETFVRAIEARDADATRRLARLARPFLLRRRKEEVARELPATSEVRVDVVLSANERERYEKVRRSALADLAKLRRGGEKPAQRDMFKMLVVLTRLRQLACHPRLVDPHAEAGSAKLERLMELAAELREEGRKMLVFSQFTELLALVRAAFDEAAIAYAYLDGSTPAERRAHEVDRFQGGTVDAFLLSLKAGGVGLNLTAASEVIHLDPWWNPAVEDQATGRAHRIGQTKPVTVYRLVAQGTIEEQIVSLHGDKRAMVAGLLDGTGSAAPVTVEELMALLSEEGLEAAAPDDDPTPRARVALLDAPVPAKVSAPAHAKAPASAQVKAPAPVQAKAPASAQAKVSAPAQAKAPAPAQAKVSASAHAKAPAKAPAPAQPKTPAPAQAKAPAPVQAKAPAPAHAKVPASAHAKVPASAKVTAAAPAKVSAAAPAKVSAPETPLARALTRLEQAAGSPLKRADLIDGDEGDEAAWPEVRAALEADARVLVEGRNRGRTYTWRTP